YPFEIFWAKTRLTKLFPANVLPYCPSIKSLLKSRDFDLVITSEVFSLNSLMLAAPRSASVGRRTLGKLIVWQELAKHNNIMHKLPSKFWYNVVARLFFMNTTVVARSETAQQFISKYCANVSRTIIDHGVNLDKFTPCTEKSNYFIIPSQLIPRKQIDKSIRTFSEFAKDKDFYLYIMGEGEERANLEALSAKLGIADKVKFFGKVPHETLKEYLAKAQAMLVYTRKDCNMVSIVESIACATPIVTTSVPFSAPYIDALKLGIVNDNWSAADLDEIVNNNAFYVNNCMNYRSELSDDRRVEQFLELI
ncbi:MAG: glycosyltransferase, partial [Eubacterium sp.]|nr:glycosyltransferase [Eubacterium sp.]